MFQERDKKNTCLCKWRVFLNHLGWIIYANLRIAEQFQMAAGENECCIKRKYRRPRQFQIFWAISSVFCTRMINDICKQKFLAKQFQHPIRHASSPELFGCYQGSLKKRPAAGPSRVLLCGGSTLVTYVLVLKYTMPPCVPQQTMRGLLVVVTNFKWPG